MLDYPYETGQSQSHVNPPERRRRWSGSSKGVSVDETDHENLEEEQDEMIEDPKLKVGFIIFFMKLIFIMM